MDVEDDPAPTQSKAGQPKAARVGGPAAGAAAGPAAQTVGAGGSGAVSSAAGLSASQSTERTAKRANAELSGRSAPSRSLLPLAPPHPPPNSINPSALQRPQKTEMR